MTPGGPAGHAGGSQGRGQPLALPSSSTSLCFRESGTWVGRDDHSGPGTPAVCSPRADNWLVDTGEDEAESQGLSEFGQVRAGIRQGSQSPSEEK